MALKYLEKSVMAPYLTEMWKRQLNTKLDPANKKWFEQGADKKVGGLYGGLEDYPERELFFDESRAQYERNIIQVSTAEHDNRNGLAEEGTVELSHTYTKSTAKTKTKSHGIKVGKGIDLSAKADFIFVEASATLKFNFEYSYNWSSSETKTETDSTTFKQSVKLKVPKGERHAAILTAQKQTLHIPYKAIIRVKGFTDTWFEHRVKDRYRHRLSGARAMANIGKWGIAGTSSPAYTEDGIVEEGVLTCEQVVDFSAKVIRLKDNLSLSHNAPIALDDPRVELIDEVKFYGDEI